MRTTILHPRRLIGALAGALVLSAMPAAAQDTSRARLQSRPTDIDAGLTEVLRPLEQTLADAILRKDAAVFQRLVAPEFTLRIADVPQSEVSRAVWIESSLNTMNVDSVLLQYCVARFLSPDFAVVSLISKQKASIDGKDLSGDFYLVDLWRQNAGAWQIVARYSSPVGKRMDQWHRPLPRAADIDPALTDTLGKLELRLGDVALHGFVDAQEAERLVGSEFTLRTSDAPERSIPRALWGKGRYKMEAIEERYFAARRLGGDLAVVSLVLSQKASIDGLDRSGDFYLVDIWKRTNRWQLIARYSSPLGRTFDRRPVP